jgi:hypothetical protein
MTIVNNATSECANFNAGDECTRCDIPAGWETYQMGDGCPDGFMMATPMIECRALEGQFCCSQGHSGSEGDCSKLMINNQRKECAFSDTANCTLSADWAPAKGLCPEGFAWPETACRSDRTCLPGLGFGALLALTFIMPASGRRRR